MAPIISFSGIASGIDSSGLIKALIDRERAARVTPLQTSATNFQDTNDSLSELKSLLSSLASAADKFRVIRGGAIAKSALSGDETVATASATNSATPGTYGLTVSQLAKNATFSFGSTAGTYTSSSDKISSGSAFSDTVSITIGDPLDPVDTVAISVDENTTLAEFVTEFNEQTSSATASVVNAGTSSSPDYRIVINTNKTGLDEGQITVSVGGTLAGRNAFNSNSENDALDAIFSVAGISGSITRSSNSVSDVLPGVSFSLKGTGSTSISVGINSSQSVSAVQDFVDAYNEVINYISENDLVTQEGEGDQKESIFGALARSSLDENIISSLRSALSGSSTSGGLVNTLSDLGIATQRDGTLAFDSSAFTTALSSDAESAGNILASLGETLSAVDGTIAQFTRFNGLIDEATNSNTRLINDIQSRVAEIEQSLSAQEQMLTQRFSRLEALIGKLNSQQSQLASILPQ